MASTASRSSYHHGDLANALSDAALALARQGGPQAVVLREAARQVGVSATAAYRHFNNHDDLMHTVKLACQIELVGRMDAALAAGPPDPDPVREAVRRLRALGRGYIRFALEEPGLFRTAFCTTPQPAQEQWDEMLAAPAFQQLTAILDELQALGALTPERRPGSEFVAWSGVHGLSVLALDGPLAVLPPEALSMAADRVQDGIVTAILGHPLR